MDCILRSYLLLAFGVFISLLLVFLSFVLYKLVKYINNKPSDLHVGDSRRFGVDSSRVI
ncbi:small hydrophobic protein p6 [Soybean leaf crinkle mottle virus]|nr:small hydrophobic protein p6 [Soybean leaf crinkle mottle virus]